MLILFFVFFKLFSLGAHWYTVILRIIGLGLLGSDLVLNNLELRLESLQELIPTPLSFEFTRGFVKVCIEE
jgi:hypothetical protein